MANENAATQRGRVFDVLLALLVVGFMISAIMYFGRVSPIRGGKLMGDPAPDIQFETPKGQRSSLSGHRGQVILINFWASWCEPCMEEMPTLRMLEEHFKQKGFSLFAFNIEDTRENTRGMIGANGFPENLIFNFSKSNLRPYDVQAIPLSLLIDRLGLVREVYAGPRNWMDISIIREIEGLLK